MPIVAKELSVEILGFILGPTYCEPIVYELVGDPGRYRDRLFRTDSLLGLLPKRRLYR